jgi:hypothetical protein
MSNPGSTYMFRKSSSSLNNSSSTNSKNTPLNMNSMMPIKLCNGVRMKNHNDNPLPRKLC